MSRYSSRPKHFSKSSFNKPKHFQHNAFKENYVRYNVKTEVFDIKRKTFKKINEIGARQEGRSDRDYGGWTSGSTIRTYKVPKNKEKEFRKILRSDESEPEVSKKRLEHNSLFK